MPETSTPTTDKAHDILRQQRKPLDALFAPKTVAVIGATENPGAVGRTILWNLITNPFNGTVFPVNPKRDSVLGIKAYKTIHDVPARVDLAVIMTPAPTVPGIIEQCVSAGVKAAIIISAGFKEIGPEGAKLEQQIMERARRSEMRIVGPNCLGLMNPLTGLNASFAKGMARPGNVAFISQSGALMTAVLDWSFKEQVGFSAFVSIGSMLDVNWGDLIDYLGDDPKTNSIVIYMESIGDARSFLSAAREVALNKPIIVIKAGRTEAAAKAAASHTGSLTGSDEVLDAAFRRSGVLRVGSISDIFSMAEVLGKQPRPQGPRLTIITNAGGPGVLATDALISNGGELTQISPETIGELNKHLPSAWSHSNPIDVLGDAPPARYEKALELAASDPKADGILVILTPQDMTDPTLIAQALSKHAKIDGKPVIASWMGGPDVEAGEAILNRAGIPTFSYPDAAAQAFIYMWRNTYALKALYETPAFDSDDSFDAVAARRIATELIETARNQGRTILDEYESKQLLSAYGIPTVKTIIASSETEAEKAAQQVGYPCVLKLYSKTITHKTDVGGVKLNLHNAQEVQAAFSAIKNSTREKAGAEHFQGVTVQPMIKLSEGYEIILGSSLDPQFGPVLLFGTGGQLVEVFKDRALGLPPLNGTLARRMMEQTRIYKALQGVRGRKSVDLPALEQILVRFSQLVAEQRWIKEIDINPMLASADQLIALDARVVVHDQGVTEDQLPNLAIRPYPTQYVTPIKLADGTALTIRPIRPEDEPLLVQFHQSLSERSVRLRYFAPLKLAQRTTHERLVRRCFNDYDREIALVIEHNDNGQRQMLGIGRMSRLPHTDSAEFAMLVSDQWQKRGLGSRLLQLLIGIARDEKLSQLTADMMPENLEMQAVCRKSGFTLQRDLEENVVHATLDLKQPPGAT